MNASTAEVDRSTVVARWITEAFAPIVLIVALLVIVAVESTGSLLRGMGIGLLAALFAGGLPYAYLLVGVRRGRFSDRHVAMREQRPLVMAVALVSVCLGLLVMWALDVPRELFALVAAMVAGVAVGLAISLWWKISIHAACAAGAVAVIYVIFGTTAALVSPIALAVAWSRVRLDDHTPSQVIAGLAVGAGVAYCVMVSLN